MAISKMPLNWMHEPWAVMILIMQRRIDAQYFSHPIRLKIQTGGSAENDNSVIFLCIYILCASVAPISLRLKFAIFAVHRHRSAFGDHRPASMSCILRCKYKFETVAAPHSYANIEFIRVNICRSNSLAARSAGAALHFPLPTQPTHEMRWTWHLCCARRTNTDID